MRAFICLSALTVILVPSRVLTNDGSIGVYSDWSATGCEITDRAGVVTVAVVQRLVTASFGSRYSAPPPACANWTFLDESPSFGGSNPGFFGGSSVTGVFVVYGQCIWLRPPYLTHITTMRFSSSGTAEACCLYTVRDHPGFPETTPISCPCWPIECAAEPASGGTAIINSRPTCSCTVPNEESTWGVIKALYSVKE